MKVVVQGRDVTLGPDEFVAAGGEGKVYAVGDTAIKVFDDPSLAPDADKLQRLSRISDPRVVIPQGPVTDRQQRVVGYTMPYVEAIAPLARVCTPSFQRLRRLSSRRLASIADAMREVISLVHAASIVIVDLSDNNVLLGSDRRTPYFIDVDSWQTDHHRASAITPSIRDPTASGPRFEPGSDWFSFAVLAFSLLVGIHPFKGKHPRVKSLADRMRQGLSVFDAEVRVPPVCRDPSVLSPDFAQWCREVFSHRHRDPPPTLLKRPRRRAPPAPVTVAAGVTTLDAPIVDVVAWDGHDIVLTEHSLFVDGRRVADRPSSSIGLWVTPAPVDRVAVVHHDPDTTRAWLSFPFGSHPEIEIPLCAHEVCIRPEALLVRTTRAVMEIGLRLIGTTAVVQSRLRVRILPRSSQLFDGVVWQSVEGKTVVSAVEHHASPQFRMPELDGSIPVDAAFVGDQIVLLTTREGRYDQWTVTLDGVSYRAVCRPDVHLGEIAWATPDGADVVWSTPAYVCGAPPPPSDVTVAVGASGAANPRPVRVSAGIGWVLGPILSAPPSSSRADRSDPRVDSGRGANGRKPPSNPATCAHVHLRTRRRAR